jgi:tight adherence protein B
MIEDLLSGNAPPETLMIMGLLMAGGLLLLVMAAFAGGGKEQKFKQRLDQVKEGRRPKAAEQQQKKLSARRRTSDSEIAALDQLIKRMLPRREQLRLRLSRAGIEAPLGRYLGICLVVGLVTAVLSFLFLPVPPGAAPFFGLIGGLALPHMVVGMLGKRRQAKFISYFPDAIDLMVRGLKSGLPIGESIKTAGEEVPDPVGIELRRVTNAVRLGSKLEEVLAETAERMDLQDFKFFTVSLAIQSETGGNLSETLSNLSNVLRGRRQLKLKIKAMSSEAKASAYIIGCLPFVVGFFLYLINADYIMKLFIDPRGNVLLALGGVSFLVGGTVMYKMVKFEI